MKINNVKVFLSKSDKGPLGNGTVTICDCVEISFTIWNSKKGPFVSFPQDTVKKDGETKYYPKVRFTDKEEEKELVEKIMAEFTKRKDEKSKKTASSDEDSDEVPF